MLPTPDLDQGSNFGIDVHFQMMKSLQGHSKVKQAEQHADWLFVKRQFATYRNIQYLYSRDKGFAELLLF